MPTKIDQLLSDYRDQNPRSYQLFQRAQSSLPGGNTRTGVYVDPFPVYHKAGAVSYTHLTLPTNYSV